jgi:hypothetical protein
MKWSVVVGGKGEMMRRVLVVFSLTLALIATGPAALAVPGLGESEGAPGQETAFENCVDTIIRQTEAGVTAGGGPKAGVPAPTNCDKFFNP